MLDDIILEVLHNKFNTGEQIKIFLVNGVKLKGHILRFSKDAIVLPSTQDSANNQTEILTYVPATHIASIEM